MTTNDPDISKVFERLLSLSEAERRREIDEIARHNPERATELDSLLAAHDAAPEFLDHLDAEQAARLLEENEPRLMPERIGGYRLIEEIGRGGLGVVYLGERVDSDFEQNVAVKLIKHGMDSESILRRFRVERRILASLAHPNIANLTDGGLLDDGRPWFAMEYIEGQRLTDWCDQQELSLNGCMHLFEQVCRAVQYAHSRLVVHRDLKPDNILVTADGTVKLLDFGIAKLLADSDDEHTQMTLAGIQAMTPEYASPEQIRGEPVSVQTDIFALGVILYQLLTHDHPFQEHNTGRAALAEAICDTDPSPPSAVVGRSGTEAGKRRPAARVRQLRGDLDTIVMTAMARDPERRYASVEALADDISRYLKGLPIRARRRSTWYAMSRFIARHRLAVGAAAAVILSLAIGLGTAMWQAREAQLQAAEANRQAERAEQVSEFLTGLFRVNDPAENRGERLTARDLLERGTERLDDDLAEQPELQLDLARLIAEIHINLGEYALARPLLDRALATNRTLEEPVSAHGLLNLRGRVEHRTGNYEPAVEWFEQAEAAASVEDNPLHLASVLNNWALSEKALGRYEAAERMHLRSLAIHETELGPDDVRIGPMLNNLGVLLWLSMERPEDARPHFERALVLYEKEYGDTHPHTLGTSSNLGWLLSQLGEFDQAEILLRRGLDGAAQLYGKDSEQYGIGLLSFGNFQSDRGNKEEAIEIYHQVHDLYVRHLGPTHDYVAYPLGNLGLRYMEKKDYAQALNYFNQALDVQRQSLAPQHPRVAIVQHSRGQALRQLDRRAEAKAAFTEALDIRESQLPEGSSQTQQTRLELLIVDIEIDGIEQHQSTVTEMLQSLPPESPILEQARERLQLMGVLEE
jgi:eukaryotic-like serine/threonine-protein kinase